MLGVTNLGDGVSQGTLSVRPGYNVEIESGASGWVAQSLPVDWNLMPGVLDLHITQRYDRRRDVGEGNCDEKEEHNEPEVRHESMRSARNVRIRFPKI